MLDEILSPGSSMDRVAPARLPERMDRPDCDPARLRDALDTLARANRRFGARDATATAVFGVLGGRSPGPVRVLDVGTGSGDIGTSVARRLRSEGWRPRVTLTDLHPRTLRIARDRVLRNGRRRPEDGTDFVRLTASSLPFARDSFDVAVSATMLHHLEWEEACSFLRELDRVAEHGWVVVDLRRSRPAYAAVRLLAATLWRRHPFPRRDGPVSVRRAFTPEEARSLVAEAGVPEATVERLRLFRLRITGRAV